MSNGKIRPRVRDRVKNDADKINNSGSRTVTDVEAKNQGADKMRTKSEIDAKNEFVRILSARIKNGVKPVTTRPAYLINLSAVILPFLRKKAAEQGMKKRKF